MNTGMLNVKDEEAPRRTTAVCTATPMIASIEHATYLSANVECGCLGRHPLCASSRARTMFAIRR